MRVLETNFKISQKKYQETINRLFEKIKYDLNKTYEYCYRLDQMDDVVRVYCPEGIFSTPFSVGKKKKTIKECKSELDLLINDNSITYDNLYVFSREVFQIRGNILGFLKEMVYEDMPFIEHEDVDEEYGKWLREAGYE